MLQSEVCYIRAICIVAAGSSKDASPGGALEGSAEGAPSLPVSADKSKAATLLAAPPQAADRKHAATAEVAAHLSCCLQASHLSFQIQVVCSLFNRTSSV